MDQPAIDIINIIVKIKKKCDLKLIYPNKMVAILKAVKYVNSS